MIIQAHAAAVHQNIIPPPPPPYRPLISSEVKDSKKNNHVDTSESKDDEKVSQDWFKSMAEEAASAALKANATLNTRNNDKKVIKKNFLCFK